MENLCTLEQVKMKCSMDTTLHDSRINYMISEITAFIVNNINNGNQLTSDNYNANQACIYGVCAWLELEGKIKSAFKTRYITKQSDGDVLTEFKATTGSGKSSFLRTYSEMYDDFFLKLKGIPSAGTYTDCNGTSNIL